MSETDTNGRTADHTFGTCCSEMKEAIQAEDFEPLITLGPDGVLYMSVGLIELEDEDEPGMVDHPVFFCPFCGTKLQSREEVQAKHDADAEQLG
ncbi:MAG: hypothetical protein AAFR75_01360 [Pseudomonadota bacterium]